MAATDLAAKRYARAAFELAVEAGSLGDWVSSLNAIKEFMEQPEIASALENSRVPLETKQRLVDAGLSDLPPMPFNLARLLVQKSRTGLAGAIASEYDVLSEEERGIVRAQATTAVALSDSDRESLIARLQEQTGKEIILETETEPELIGGLVVQIGDRLVDMSTRSRLRSLRESLMGAV